jgi:hypothetical protein
MIFTAYQFSLDLISVIIFCPQSPQPCIDQPLRQLFLETRYFRLYRLGTSFAPGAVVHDFYGLSTVFRSVAFGATCETLDEFFSKAP